MVQLEILSGKTAGSVRSARRFPFTIGRGSKCHLQLEEDGVWDKHATLKLRRGEGFIIEAEQNALLSVNNEPATKTLLRNGDLLVMGSVSARFWLAPPRQRGLSTRELFVWALVILITAAQLAVIYHIR